jgi:hypothetical protein
MCITSNDTNCAKCALSILKIEYILKSQSKKQTKKWSEAKSDTTSLFLGKQFKTYSVLQKNVICKGGKNETIIQSCFA